MKKRLISVLLIVVMLCNIQVPTLSVLGDTTNKELYDKYGMSIQTLFEEYPECLNNEAFFNLMVEFGETYKEVLSHYKDQAGVAAFITTLKQGGLTVFGREFLAKIGLTQNNRDKMLTETVQALMREAGANKNIIYEISSELEENYSIFDAGYSIANKAAKIKFIQDLKKASKYISDKTAEDMFEYMTESGDKIMEKIDTGVSLSQVILTTFQLQELEFALIDRLLVLLPEEGCLHEGLVLLRKQIDQNIITHINQGILTEGIFNLIEEAIKQGGELLFGKGVVDVANLAIWLFTDIIYQGATAEEIAQTIYFCSCVNEIKTLVDNKRFEIWSKHYNNENVTEQDIGDYEILMSLYIVTTRMTLEHAKKMAPNSGLKAQCQNNLDLLNDFMSYDNYIALCLNEAKEKNDSLITEEKVLEKIDKLVKIFNAENGKMYFTSDGNPDRSPYDTSYVNSVISSSWFKKTFSDFGIPSGNDIANVVSNHYYPSNKKNNPGGLPRGTSCHGFGTWAVWYLFASNNSDFVQLEYVISNGEDSTAKLDYKTLSKYAKPGDLIRIQSTKDSSYGHSVIFISCDESGVTVLDCNWNGTCNIRKHTIPYTMDSASMGQWGKCPIAISRASSYSVSIDDSVNITEIPNGEQWRVDRGSMNLRIRSGASTAYSQVGLVTFQDIVTVKKIQGNWGYITYNGVSGWICLDYCTKIEPTITQGPSNTSIPTVTIAPSNTTIPTTTPILTDFGWIKASECPADANIVDTKWTYTYKETIEDSRPWIEGWTYGGERLETISSGTFEYATFPNTFDKSSAIYTGMYTSKEAVPVTDGTERRIISDNMTGYIYWHYSYPISDRSVGDRIVGYYYNQHLKVVANWCYVTNFAAFKSPKTYRITANNKAGGGTVYKITDSEYMDYSIAKGSYWWYRFEYYTCNYEDVKTIYQHYRLVDKESVTEVVEGDAISNVVKWVKIEPIITVVPGTPTPTLRQETATEYFDYTIENGKVTIKGLKDKSLTTVVIPEKIEGYDVISIAVSALQYCNNLSSISIPNSVISIGDYAFANCSSLSSIIIPSSVTNIGVGIFNSCNNLIEIIVESNNIMYSSKDGVLYNKDQTMLLCVPAGKKLQEYIIPNHVTSIGYYAFSDCTSLKSISISDNVSNIGEYAFNYCSSLTEINVTENNLIYSSKDGVLYNKNQNVLLCMPSGKDLKNYEMPANIDTIGSAAFYDCKSLSSINISNNVTSIGNWAFAFCSNLNDINISDSVTSIGEHAFFSCSNLKSVSLSHNMDKIQYATFYDCSNLISIIIPDGITMIDLGAFSTCNSLVSITIPSSVISINKDAFVGSNNVTIITPKGSYAEKYAKENNIPYENN